MWNGPNIVGRSTRQHAQLLPALRFSRIGLALQPPTVARQAWWLTHPSLGWGYFNWPVFCSASVQSPPCRTVEAERILIQQPPAWQGDFPCRPTRIEPRLRRLERLRLGHANIFGLRRYGPLGRLHGRNESRCSGSLGSCSHLAISSWHLLAILQLAGVSAPH